MEPRQARTEEHQHQPVRVPLVLRSGELRLSIDPDGSIRYLESLSEGRLLFGRDQLYLYREQGGGFVQVPRQEWRVYATAREAAFTSRADSVDVSTTIRLFRSSSSGYSRRTVLRNQSAKSSRVRLISLSDPTTAQFRERGYGWGSIGVNAFNRASHVAIDEVVEPSSSRVIGSRPPPKTIYMTSDRTKALELVERGELPDQTAGMSGQVVVLLEHDCDIQPGASVEVTYLSLYNKSRLETALTDFEASFTPSITEATVGAWFASSSPHVGPAFRWALAALEGAQFERDSLDRVECLRGLALVGSEVTRSAIESAGSSAGSSGSLPHSLDATKPGLLETSIFLDGASRFAIICGDKKYARSIYPLLRRSANFLLESSRDGVVKLDPGLPQGWRRRIGKGYPAGEVPEVNLSVAAALGQISAVASYLGKTQDSAKYRERSLILVASVKKRLVDERGFLALCLSGDGRLRVEETIDQAVACYRLPFDTAVSTSIVHRMLERDFDTGLGPRTLPTSNRLVFNPSYGDGQLGGYWTRAALAHTVLAYLSVLGGTGSLELEAIGRMVSSEFSRYGSAPGDFPYWLDPARREARSQGSDPVAAARYLDAAITGELGVSAVQGGLSIDPSVSSSLRWVAGGNLLANRKVSAFVGRAAGRAYAFVCGAKAGGTSDVVFTGSELAKTDDSRALAMSFFGPGQVICAGNSSDATVKTVVQFGPRDPGLAKKLTASLNELDVQSGTWKRISSIKVLPSMSFDFSLGPSDWKAFQIAS